MNSVPSTVPGLVPELDPNGEKHTCYKVQGEYPALPN
jgi:hypothetical protein